MNIIEKFKGAVGVENLEKRFSDLRYVLARYQVNSVLEFGSGTSTKFFSDNIPFIQTVDEKKKFLRQTKKACRKADIAFTYSPRMVYKSSVNYKNINYKRTDFNMIYVDGPNAKKPGGQHTVCMDTVLYLYRVATQWPEIIMVDGRKVTVDFLLRVLKDYDFEELERHTLFVRNL